MWALVSCTAGPRDARSLAPVTEENRSGPAGAAARDEVLDVVRAVVGAGRTVVGRGTDLVGGGADDAMRMLLDRRVRRVVRTGSPVVRTAVELVGALERETASTIAPWIGAGVSRLARTRRVAKALGGRSPVGLAVRFGPTIHAAVSGNLHRFDAAASYLVGRAVEQQLVPDPVRIRRAVVQALAGDPIDPKTEPDHASLLGLWFQGAARDVVPFGHRIAGLRPRRTPEAIAAALERAEVAALARR